MTATYRSPAQRAATFNMRAKKMAWGQMGKPSPLGLAVEKLQAQAAYVYVRLGRVGRCSIAQTGVGVALYNGYVSASNRRYIQTFDTLGDALVEAHKLANAATA